MTRILRGVIDFQRRIFGPKQALFQQLGKGQKPLALFITCSDSRVNPNLLTQTEPGELFILRNAGNLVPVHSVGSGAEAATVEYALVQLRIHDVIVCGHSKCGAMHGLLEPSALARLPSVSAWLTHASEVLAKVQGVAGLTPEQQLERAIEQNVLVQLEHLRTHPAVADGLAARTLRLHGWVYHFEKGQVDAYDPVSGTFIPVEQHVRQRLLEHAAMDTGPRTEWETHI
jgi:carbonic anhydrase